VETIGIQFCAHMAPPSLVVQDAATLLPVTRPDKTTMWHEGVVPFLLQHAYGGIGKVVQSAGMVKIEMRQHDVLHVCRLKTQSFELPQRRHFYPKIRAKQCQEKAAEAARRVGYVAQSKPVSTSTRPCSLPTRRQWQHSSPRFIMKSVGPSISLPPRARRNAVHVVHAHCGSPGRFSS
jgi:hypothetical protein